MSDPATAIFRDDCLRDRAILVTGASSGLGRAAAIGLAAAGARLILAGRNEERLQQTLDRMTGSGHAVVTANLLDVDGTAEVVRNVASEHGPLHGVYHAAGITLTLPVKLTKQRHVDDVFGPSVYGAYGIARAAGQKNVMAPDSSLVFMSSVSAERGYHGMMVYAGAKSAVHGLVRAAAIELASRRIRVNAIVSGAIFTEMFANEAARMGSDWADKVAARHPLGFGQPEDMTAAVIFLMSDGAKWITGTTMRVDGGYTTL